VLDANPRVLIADDSRTNRAAIRRIVEEFHAEVVECANGVEALAKLEAREFALVVLDVKMPELDGFETVRRMRSMPTAYSTPVVFISAAYTENSHRQTGFELGAVDYLTGDSIEPDALRQKVRVFLDLYRKRVELQALLSRVQLENEKLYMENEQFRAARTALELRAMHDPLTGLPNRALLNDRGNSAIARARRNGSSFAIVFIDLDSFKVINDNYGHAAGDELLTEVARRLINAVRRSDTVARMGGDEFIVLMETLDHEKRAAQIARKILTAMEVPLQLHSRVADTLVTIRQTASIGIAQFPADADDVEGLLVLSDLAMYEAKRQGGARVKVYRDVARQRSATGGRFGA
jgi:diguanylate cyclase (GGDEF)-like protein